MSVVQGSRIVRREAGRLEASEQFIVCLSCSSLRGVRCDLSAQFKRRSKNTPAADWINANGKAFIDVIMARFNQNTVADVECEICDKSSMKQQLNVREVCMARTSVVLSNDKRNKVIGSILFESDRTQAGVTWGFDERFDACVVLQLCGLHDF